MARRPGLPPPQLRALDRLKSVRGIDRFYLAGGAAIAAHLRHREENPAAILSTLTVDDHRSKSGEKRYMLGREPILTRDGKRIVDRRGRGSYVTSAGAGPSVGKHILMAYLTPEEAVVGNQLLVEYMGERYPVSVAVAGATPLFDPENNRIRS